MNAVNGSQQRAEQYESDVELLFAHQEQATNRSMTDLPTGAAISARFKKLKKAFQKLRSIYAVEKSGESELDRQQRAIESHDAMKYTNKLKFPHSWWTVYELFEKYETLSLRRKRNRAIPQATGANATGPNNPTALETGTGMGRDKTKRTLALKSATQEIVKGVSDTMEKYSSTIGDVMRQIGTTNSTMDVAVAKYLQTKMTATNTGHSASSGQRKGWSSELANLATVVSLC